MIQDICRRQCGVILDAGRVTPFSYLLTWWNDKRIVVWTQVIIPLIIYYYLLIILWNLIKGSVLVLSQQGFLGVCPIALFPRYPYIPGI
jgi:hypothetical protein